MDRQIFDTKKYIDFKDEIKIKEIETNENKNIDFYKLCKEVKTSLHEFLNEASLEELNIDNITLHKNAILGKQEEQNFYFTKIREHLESNKIKCKHPTWYQDLVSAIFHENWGFAGLEEWLRSNNSSSAKIIGERIYFMINGELKKMPQSISQQRLEQLKTALMLKSPKTPYEDYMSLYMLNGNRVQIFDEGVVKEGQKAIVFRNYTVKQYTFEKQVELKTIDVDMPKLFKAMVKVGFNVAFLGAVRSSKTTMLATYQRYENERLEGVMIETDPEIPLHIIMPDAPIMQIVAKDEKLKKIMTPLMRSDADYLIMAEARDGASCYIAVKACNKGTKRVKMSYHTTDPEDFCYDVADDIVKEMGGKLEHQIVKVAKAFQILFMMKQMEKKDEKILEEVFVLDYDRKLRMVKYIRLAKYDYENKCWTYNKDCLTENIEKFITENRAAYTEFKDTLSNLDMKKPMAAKDREVIIPFYGGHK